VDLRVAAVALGSGGVSGTLAELVEAGDEGAGEAWSLAGDAVARGLAARPYTDCRPLAPFPAPRRNVICVGKNYRAHVDEVAATALQGGGAPERPIFFTKATTTVIGPGEPIPSHAGLTSKLDYEAEAAIVIGRGGRDIAPEEAWKHVFGYTAINDISARDLQAAHVQWFLGKSLDGSAPMGPLVVHRTAMPPPDELWVRSWVNGELRQAGNLGQLIFDVPTLIATLSAAMTLLPGDIIATGTPAGVGAGFDPPRFLEPGEEVVVEVTGVGRLANRVR